MSYQHGGYGPAPSPPPAYGPQNGPIGKQRSTGIAMLLFIVTFGIYGLVWFFLVHEEMQRHTGNGIGGVLALIIAIFVSPVQAFLTSNEVGSLYERTSQPKPVSVATGLWYFPGIFLVVLPIVWFVKTNGALSDYWRSVGAP